AARMRHRIVPLLAMAGLAGCIEAPPLHDLLVSRQDAVGVPEDGHPSPSEREMLVLTNQVRASPANQCGDWTEELGTEPRGPLRWSHAGGRGARITAEHLHDGRCFPHPSCCTLEKREDGTVGCAGDWIPPCGGTCGASCTGGTDTGARYHLF